MVERRLGAAASDTASQAVLRHSYPVASRGPVYVNPARRDTGGGQGIALPVEDLAAIRLEDACVSDEHVRHLSRKRKSIGQSDAS